MTNTETEMQGNKQRRLVATKIVIHRAEGPVAQCRTVTFTGSRCWPEAEGWIWTESSTAPRTGGYDKCDVEITFEDDGSGDPLVYRTRYDMVHRCCDNFEPLALHVKRAWEFYAGRWIPVHMDRARWEQFVKNCEVDVDGYNRLCDRYHVPGMGV